MNVAFSRKITPLMYMLLMGYDYKLNYFGFERFDDIWAGIIAKKVMDHLGLGVISGSPILEHQKASNPFDNLKKEAVGIKYNEFFWKIIDEIKLTKSSILDSYKEIARKAKFPREDYFDKLRKAMLEWSELFD